MIDVFPLNFAIIGFILHEECLGDELVQLLLVTGLVVEIHDLFLTIVTVYFFGFVDRSSHLELSHRNTLHLRSLYAPIQTPNFTLNVDSE